MKLEVCLFVPDDGGVFKSRTRRQETRDAAPIRDSRETVTDLPVDYVRAEQVKVRIHFDWHGSSALITANVRDRYSTPLDSGYGTVPRSPPNPCSETPDVASDKVRVRKYSKLKT